MVTGNQFQSRAKYLVSKIHITLHHILQKTF
jgi:hypothetical protein